MESSELLRQIRSAIQGQIETPTDEWKTSRQWMREWGLKQSQTNRILNDALESGMMEVRSYRIACATRSSYPTPHYRHKTTP